ncbi:hypothetical protein H0H93_005391 [Arthromyces matolae]|nr:hypothetical protein H0H93_005391 [Arthromyces matolae]
MGQGIFISLWLLGSAWLHAALCATPIDPCAAIAGKKWVLPVEARACLSATPLNPEIKANILEAVNKTLAFHTSVNYQIRAPPPFDQDVKEDLKADLARISLQNYYSDFAFHLDLYHSFKRVNDGHCGVYNYCYDSVYVTYLPIPLVLLTNEEGTQSVYIAPEAHKVAFAEFESDIQFWEDALPGKLKGKLSSLSGAKVLLINGMDPFVAVDSNALVTGGYQSFATRQNAYHRGPDRWEYVMGNFAQQVHPLIDSVSLLIQRANSSSTNEIVLPYRSRFGSASKNFTDLASFWENNCRATNKTNGHNLYSTDFSPSEERDSISFFQQQAPPNPREARQHAMNVILDGMPMSNIALPEELQPKAPFLNESYSVAQFYLLNDNITGVLALGSFSAENFTEFGIRLLSGLQELKTRGATRLVVDVSNNGGDQIIGPKYTTEPQAGLDTTVRAGPLAQLIVDKIAQGGDPDDLLYYNPTQWNNASHMPFSERKQWFAPTSKIINGHEDAFSSRTGMPAFQVESTRNGTVQTSRRRYRVEWKMWKLLFVIQCENMLMLQVVYSVLTSGEQITMSKRDGVKTVVVGGKRAMPQQYCGTVGGQSTGFSTIDTEIKVRGAPPHFAFSSYCPDHLEVDRIEGPRACTA